MSDHPYIVDVTLETFEEKVLRQSEKTPVLVDFWAAWCGPCQMLAPLLESLVDHFGGGLIVAKVNSDEQGELAAQYGVRSLPTLKLFRHGQVVDETLGAQPESVLRALVEPHIVRESDQAAAQALELVEAGQVDEGLEALKAVAAADPGNSRIALALASVLLDTGEPGQAAAALDALPPAQRTEPEVLGLKNRIRFARLAAEAPPEASLLETLEKDPNDLQARYQLSARYLQRGDYPRAMQQLLRIMQQDRSFEDDLGRRTLLEVFDMIPDQEDLVGEYRRKMFAAMH